MEELLPLRGGVRSSLLLSRLPSMWCRHCQQDVSAARDATGPPACPRCRITLRQPNPLNETVAAVADCGVALDAFDRPASDAAATGLERPVIAADGDELRRMERILRPTLRVDASPIGAAIGLLSGAADQSPDDGHDIDGRLRDGALNLRHASVARPASTAWGISLLLAAGGTMFVCGLMLLAAANMLVHAVVWRWGFATTIAGEGLLIAGLAAMATRLWRNSRRLNSQLDVLDQRLGDVQANIERAAEAPTRAWQPGLLIDAGERLDRSRLALT